MEKQFKIFKLMKGEYLGLLPYGYKSIEISKRTKYKKHTKIIIIEQELIIIKDIFNTYSTGKISLTQLTHYINNKYKTSIARSSIHKFIKNKFYIGIMTWGNKEYKHIYQKMIDEKTFYKCEEILKFNKKNILYSDVNHTKSMDEEKSYKKEKIDINQMIIKLCETKIHKESIAERLSIPPIELDNILLNLEISGVIKEIFSGVYTIKNK